MNEDCVSISHLFVPAYRFTDNIGSESRQLPLRLPLSGGSMVAFYLFSFFRVYLGRTGGPRHFAARGPAQDNWSGVLEIYDAQRPQCSRETFAFVVSSLAVNLWHMQVSERLTVLTGLHRTLRMLCSVLR
jgi:hypothetical protein